MTESSNRPPAAGGLLGGFGAAVRRFTRSADRGGRAGSSAGDPAPLFDRLCAEHALEPADAGALRELAAAAALDPPALVFLRPDLFGDRHAGLRAGLFGEAS